MGWEIERRFLVADDAWRAQADAGTPLRQGYVAGHRDGLTVRVRIQGERAWLTLKGPSRGATRAEFEYPIPLADAVALLDGHREGGEVQKVRHRVPVGPHTFEIDHFGGENAGLVLAEVELGAEDEAFERPAWLGPEITGDGRYSNAALAREPWRRWGWREPGWAGAPEHAEIWDPDPQAVLDALASLGPGDLVATDADGTLWAGDCGDDAVRWVALARDPAVDVPAYLAREAVDYGGACRQAAEILARVADLEADAPAAAGLGPWLAERIRPRAWLVAALRAAEARGVRVVVVTAAPRAAAERALRALDLPAWPVVGIEVGADGVAVEPAPVGPGKPLALAAEGHGPAALALGDTRHDLPLLRSARRAFWLRPAT